ncbi:DNA mismatch repair endonuclease MutL [Candidatus Symbiopectobacterium sp. 'North America']|uniref:DNA mismatch repair endonuclease MutL n=1 Tax=Candidatus Symbiopectobacterium sp. 'North America' TaxID=2794574 RepID=UPI0018C93A97|nr:DNA mismatch repair endonuclease MutL [Candidatus Symbiopectobacterium sp. 'North America']MBG6245937.1 DNA mismatch repair endonuclease MutL [Candidatus Symbiopectobacterium sp. 'North America']
MPIQVLPPQLANQIAAGEVVERPASVVKELVENSLDAGATRIDIDIDRGGAKRIRIRDNGTGIGKDDLALALARHATSKIATLDDLEAIISLGFRGEALASISSVSRLTLTSRTAEQNEAWQAYAEGRDMAVTVKPAAHPVGTTLEVLDLFYNTPARRKFMRTEKTEFAHIDEVVRRIALARFDVAFTLNHNGKTIRQYRAAPDASQHERRVGSICGPLFLQHALRISWQHSDLSIHGWVADPEGAKQLTDMQYCYVNQRMMRDRLINHAIRQAYQDSLHGEQQPAYLLFLEVDPHQVDVNVHPAKHEVRFHESRLVHDFIYQAVVSVLQQASELPLTAMASDVAGKAIAWQPENRIAAGENQFAQPARPVEHASPKAADVPARQMKESAPAYQSRASQTQGRGPMPLAGAPYQKKLGELYQTLLKPASIAEAVQEPIDSVVSAPVPDLEPVSMAQGFGRLLTVFPPSFALVEYQHGLAMVSLTHAERYLKRAQLLPQEQGLRPQPLLIPQRLAVEKNEREALLHHQALLAQFGIDIALESQRALLRAVPLPLRQQNLQNLISELLGYLALQPACTPEQLATWLSEQLHSDHERWSQAQAIQLLTEIERLCPELPKQPPASLLQRVSVEDAIKALKV